MGSEIDRYLSALVMLSCREPKIGKYRTLIRELVILHAYRL